MKLATDYLRSSYLTQADFPEPTRVKIIGREDVNLTRPGQPREKDKAILWFENFDRPLVINSTNLKILIKLFGADMDTWLGRWIVVFVDPNVEYAGEITGGLRVRAATPAKPAASQIAEKVAARAATQTRTTPQVRAAPQTDPVEQIAAMPDDLPDGSWEEGRQ